MEKNKVSFKFLSILLMMIMFSNAPLHAQIIDTTIKHIVKSGETLHSITRSYLGTDILWKENWKLNPHVQNPHVLTIGEELTIIQQREIPAEKATMLEVINKVERKKNTGDWLQASKGDQLIQKEGVRTFNKSSVLLKLNDASQFKILEFSQVFLQSRETTLRGTDSATIEIIKGDAELHWDNIDVKKSEISIVSGSTTLQPSTQKGKTTALRTGVLENGNSVISVYEGDSQVESAGQTVAISQGMGMKVRKGQAPPKPTPLLKAPRLSVLDQSFNYSNPILSWGLTKNAVKYVLEVCTDINCDQVMMQKHTTTNATKLSDFKQSGQFYWRVAGIDKDDIVGFRSEPQSLIITSDTEDLVGPVVALDVLGLKQVIDGIMVIAAQAEFNIISQDKQAGVKSVQYRWNDGNWHNWDNKPILYMAGAKKFEIQAIDSLDNVANYSYRFKN